MTDLPNLDLMDVEERRELLNAYIDGELSAEEALHVSSWLDDNPGSLRVIEHMRHIDDLLETYEDEPVPTDFAARVLHGVGVGRKRRAGKVISMAWYRRPLATAAAVLVAVGATAFVMRGGQDGPVVPQATTDVVSLLQDVPDEELGDLLLNADVLLSVDDAALEDEGDDEGVIGG